MDVNVLLSQSLTGNQSTWYIVALSFLAGVLVSFTPCIYPMIPITAGILQSQGPRSWWYSFFSSLAYVCGIALIYATLGYVSAMTGIIFGSWFAQPWFVLLVIAFFMYLAFSMFGFYELYIPSFALIKDGGAQQRSLFNCFILGIVSGTVTSPCLTPALGLLLGIAAKQPPLIGFLMLFSFALGLGVLLLIVGTFSSSLTLLPRAGEWMDQIKKAFGFIILAMCGYFAQGMIGDVAALAIYLIVALAATAYYWTKGRVGLLAIVLGALALFAALAVASVMLQPLLR
jgi:thiol:disulfide interchange protein DsbD